jgi:hypothetical protein
VSGLTLAVGNLGTGLSSEPNSDYNARRDSSRRAGFFLSFLNGVGSGLISPIEELVAGVNRGSPASTVTGLLRGVAGVIVKPVAGLVDGVGSLTDRAAPMLKRRRKRRLLKRDDVTGQLTLTRGPDPDPNNLDED